jgi:hypothetical protein
MVKYTCSNLKLSDLEPQRLSELKEQRHTLQSVNIKYGQCIAKFPNGEFVFPEELEPKLRSLIGHKIGILRLGDYRIRDLEAEDA